MGNVKELLLFMLMTFCMGDPVILKKSQMKFTESLLWVRIVMFHSNTLELMLIGYSFTYRQSTKLYRWDRRNEYPESKGQIETLE